MNSGLSGDLALAGICQLGCDAGNLEEVLSSAAGVKISLELEDRNVSGIMCKKLKLELPHEHKHRNLDDIKKIIDKSALSDRAKLNADACFTNIAEAEAHVHGISIDKVHFHEVGALDSIVDILGFVHCVEELGIHQILCSTPKVATGTVKCAHGVMPLPSPATLRLLEGSEVIRLDENAELTTPTGAAIIKTFATVTEVFSGKILKTAYSTGNNVFRNIPNICRSILIEDGQNNDRVLEMSTNIDDMNPEGVGPVIAGLLNLGALDVFYTPVYGKKNRPAVVVTALVRESLRETAAQFLFRNTSTAGLRYRPLERIVMDRVVSPIDEDGQLVGIKKLTYKDIEKYSVEWDDCEKAAERLNIAPYEVYMKALSMIGSYEI